MPATRPRAKSISSQALGARLRIEREAHGMTITDLAQAIGVSVNTLRWHEAGSRMLRADELSACANILRLSPQHLMVPHYDDRQPDQETRHLIGRRMASIRARANKSREALVKGTSVPVHDVRYHEMGSRSMRCDQLVALAAVLKVDPGSLLKPEKDIVESA